MNVSPAGSHGCTRLDGDLQAVELTRQSSRVLDEKREFSLSFGTTIEHHFVVDESNLSGVSVVDKAVGVAQDNPTLGHDTSGTLKQVVEGLVRGANRDPAPIKGTNRTVSLSCGFDCIDKTFQSVDGSNEVGLYLLSELFRFIRFQSRIDTQTNLLITSPIEEGVGDGLDIPPTDADLVSIDLVDVIVEKDLTVTTTVVSAKVVTEHPKLDSLKVSTNQDVAWAGNEQLSESRIRGDLGQVGIAVSTPMGVGGNQTPVMDPSLTNLLEPGVPTLREEAQELGEFQKPEELLSEWVVDLLQRRFIDLPLASVCLFLELDSLLLQEPSNVVPRGWVEVNDLGKLSPRNVSFDLVSPLWGERAVGGERMPLDDFTLESFSLQANL